MNVYAITSLIGSASSLFLGIFVYLKNKEKAVNKSFGLLSLGIFIWVFGCFMESSITTHSSALFWDKFLYTGAAFAPTLFLHFSLVFTGKKRKKILITLYLLSIIFLFLNLTPNLRPLFIKDVQHKFPFRYIAVPGPIWYLYLLYFAFCGLYPFYILAKTFKEKISSYKKEQLKYLTLSLVVIFIAACMYLCLVLSVAVPPIDNLLVAVFSFITSYTIVRYHLMDITIAIKKTTLLACGVLLPTAGVVIGINLLQPKLTKIMGESWWLVPSGITVILTLALFRFVNYVIRLKDEELNKSIKHYRNQLRAHTEQLAKSKTTRELVSYTVRHISTIAKLDFCAIALKKEEIIEDEIIVKKRKFYIIEGVSDRTGRHLSRLKGERIEENSDLITYLKITRKPIEKGYLQYLLTQTPSLPQKDLFFEITQEMEEWDTELIFPAFSSDELVGLLFLGRKINGAIYSKEDLELFSLLANQSAKPISELIQREENIRMILATAHSYLNTLEAKDNYTRGHTERVKDYCLKIASSEIIKAQLEKIPDGVWGLEMAAKLHDLGKIGIPDNVLNKPMKLTPEEFNLVKEHPKEALNMIGEVSVWLKEDIILGILEHQEHYDGTGYPKGLRGDNIHLYARIIHLADAYDAMTSERPYRQTLSPKVAIEEIKKNSGNQFDPLISGVFIKLYQEDKI